jgi:2-octaprenyl-6-methoxyphenol hydroxylase
LLRFFLPLLYRHERALYILPMNRKKTPEASEIADIAIVGGGLAGLALAALLGEGGADVLCLDRDPPVAQLKPGFDGRTTAISFGSRQILEQAGVWPGLETAGQGACPIETIHILDGRTKGPPLVFNSGEVGGRAFGWIVENADFRRCLQQRVAALPSVRHLAPATVASFDIGKDSVTIETPEGFHQARVVIGADGRNSFVREWMGVGSRGWSYRQQAVICTIVHEHPHNHIAVEHFRSEGPFAILPMADDAQGRHRSSVVWTADAGRDSPLDWPQPVFEAGLAARFPAWYGKVGLAGPRFAHPLSLNHAHRYIGPRMALVADAAHAIHPIAGQGLNLGFRDIAALAPLLLDAIRDHRDPGSPDVLDRYQRLRRVDNMAMAGATDQLNRLFSNEGLTVSLARRAGMKAVGRLPFAKRFFMSQAMGLGRSATGK